MAFSLKLLLFIYLTIWLLISVSWFALNFYLNCLTKVDNSYYYLVCSSLKVLSTIIPIINESINSVGMFVCKRDGHTNYTYLTSYNCKYIISGIDMTWHYYSTTATAKLIFAILLLLLLLLLLFLLFVLLLFYISCTYDGTSQPT